MLLSNDDFLVPGYDRGPEIPLSFIPSRQGRGILTFDEAVIIDNRNFFSYVSRYVFMKTTG